MHSGNYDGVKYYVSVMGEWVMVMGGGGCGGHRFCILYFKR